MLDVPIQPPLDEQSHKPQEVGVLRNQVPVKPARLVVLTVGIIVAALAAHHLIAHNKHRNSGRQQHSTEEVLRLPVPQSLDCRIVRRTLDTAVPASVVAGPVPVALPILFVVLVVVRDEVVERETVVARREIDTLLEFALLLTIDAWTAEQAIG